MARRGRGIREEERALWTLATQSMRPLRRPASASAPETVSAPPLADEPPHLILAPPSVPAFRIGERGGQRAQPTPAPPTTTVDRRALADLKTGRRAPEARLDLHGMTLDEAYSALTGFLAACEARNLRLVHVITGKGSGSGVSRQRGELRRQVPLWLRTPPMSLWVREAMPSHTRHGGDGALYVWMRRRR
jgi:DNA-nicking Smr family endonuclease